LWLCLFRKKKKSIVSVQFRPPLIFELFLSFIFFSFVIWLSTCQFLFYIEITLFIDVTPNSHNVLLFFEIKTKKMLYTFDSFWFRFYINHLVPRGCDLCNSEFGCEVNKVWSRIVSTKIQTRILQSKSC
jgi:hypothetical protein